MTGISQRRGFFEPSFRCGVEHLLAELGNRFILRRLRSATAAARPRMIFLTAARPTLCRWRSSYEPRIADPQRGDPD